SDVSIGVVNWPLTYPAQAVDGYVISDHYVRLASTFGGVDDPLLIYPAGLHREALPIVQAASSDPTAAVAATTENGVAERHQLPGRTDRAYARLTDAVGRVRPVQVTVMRYQSLDPIGHYFLRFATPSAFGDVSDEERRTLGSILESHYALLDE